MNSVNGFLLLTVAVILPAFTQARDIDYGKELHDEHCVQCHSAAIYTRENRLVNSFGELKERVRQCELANQMTWFDEDISAVIDYLNTTYYKFEIE